MRHFFVFKHRFRQHFLLLFIFISLSSYSQTGELDLSFNSLTQLYNATGNSGIGGTYTEGIKTAVTQPDGKVIIGGEFTSINNVNMNRIARLNSDGSLDTSFQVGTGAYHFQSTTNSVVTNILLQPDGKIIVAGKSITYYNGALNYNIFRLNSNGTIDTTFNTGGGIGSQFPNIYYSGSGVQSYTNATINSMVLQSDGKIIIAGDFDKYSENTTYKDIVRLNANGTVDTSFNPATILNNTSTTKTRILKLSLDGSGKIIVCLDYVNITMISSNTNATQTSNIYLKRLNPNGSLDSSFSVNNTLFSTAYHNSFYPFTGNRTAESVACIKTLKNGKILISGDFTSVYGNNKKSIALLNTNGTVDTTFGTSIGAVFPHDDYGTSVTNGNIKSFVVQSDDKIIIGGDFISVNGTNINGIARLTVSGILDTTFDPGTGVLNGGSINTLEELRNSEIMLSGSFMSYNGITMRSIARLKGNINAVNDTVSIDVGTISNIVSNVISNDTYYNTPATFSNVTLSFINSSNSNITLNTSTGAVNVSSYLPIGSYTLTYQICSVSSPSLCDVGTVIINVVCNYPQTLDLVTKDSIDDIGAQPNVTTVYPWASTDIWIRNQPDGIDEHQNPEYSSTVPNYVYVRVKNKSCVVSSGNDILKVYWAKAGTGLNWPDVWNGSLTFSNNALQGSPIGSVSIPVLQPGQEVVLQLDFLVPNPNDYVAVSGPDAWHFCLLSRIESVADPMISETSDLVSNVLNNNNIAWKNITIVDLMPNVLGGINDGGVIAVGNLHHQPRVHFLEFIEDKDNEKPLYEEAEVTIKMDEVVYNAWVKGGKKSTFLGDTKDENVKVVKDNHALLEGLMFDENEVGTVVVKFNFLTKELTDKMKFTYNVVQKEAEAGNLIGGETYVIKKHERTLFYADGGGSFEVDKNDPITISAEQISEPAVYNWYDSTGNLVYTGRDLTVTTDVSTKYKLEVIALSDGFKDYSEVEISLKPNSLSIIAPNPAIDIVNIGYKINEADSAYLMIMSSYGTTGISNNYILDLNNSSSDINIDLSNYNSGMYTVALVCDGQIVDAKTLVKQ